MSSVFLSFGPKSGFLHGHLINSLIECTDSPPIWYTESYTGLLPNAVFFDNVNSVRFYESYEKDEDDVRKETGISRLEKLKLPDDGSITIPKFKPTPFIEYIRDGGRTSIPLNEARPNFLLETCDPLGWCDIVNFNLNRRSFVELPGTDIEPINSYQSGFERASDSQNREFFIDPIRRTYEACDRVTSVVVSADRNSGYGGFSMKLCEYVLEESPKATRFVFHTSDDVESDFVAANASCSLAAALDFAHIHSVLVQPEKLPEIIDTEKYLYKNDYSRMGLFSYPLLSALLPIFNGSTTARRYQDVVAPTNILKFAGISSNFPAFHEMCDFGFNMSGRIYSRLVALNATGEHSDKLKTDLKPDSPYFFEYTEQKQPIFVGFTSPHFFKDGLITAEGGKPTIKPNFLSDEQYRLLVQTGAVKEKPAVSCDKIKILSSAASISTTASLAESLKNSVDFIKNAHITNRDISQAECTQLVEVVYNIIDGLLYEDNY